MRNSCMTDRAQAHPIRDGVRVNGGGARGVARRKCEFTARRFIEVPGLAVEQSVEYLAFVLCGAASRGAGSDVALCDSRSDHAAYLTIV